MDRNNEPEAKISKEETRTLLMIDLRQIPQLPIRISPRDKILLMGTAIQITEDQMTNSQISHSKKAMGTDFEIILSTIRMETGETTETFLVLHRLQ